MKNSLPAFLQPLALVAGQWEPLRLALLQRMLLLTALLCAVMGLRAHFGTAMLAPNVAAVGMCLGGLLLLHLWPGMRQWFCWATLLALTGVVAWALRVWPDPPPASTLLYVVIVATLGLILDGPRLGWTLLAASAGLIGWAAQGVQTHEQARGVIIYAFVTAAFFAMALGWHRALARGLGMEAAARRALVQQRDESQTLVFGLFHGLARTVAAMKLETGEVGGLAWGALGRRTAELRAQTAELKRARSQHADYAPARLDEADFVRDTARLALWVSLVLALGGELANQVWPQGGLLHVGVGALLPIIGLPLLREGRPAPRPLLHAIIWQGPLIILADTLRLWGQQLPRLSALWSLSILAAGLLLGRRWAITAGAAAVALTLAAARALPPSAALSSTLEDLLGSWMMVLAVCLLAMQLQRAMLLRLVEGTEDLARSLRMRRRLLGTLFHDTANLLMPLELLTVAARAGAVGPEDEARVRRIVERLQAMLHGSAIWLLEEDRASDQLRPVGTAQWVQALEDVFDERLRVKQLKLHIDGDASARVRAIPEVLQESVMGNLLSNAIKFSPPGGSIDLVTERQDGFWGLGVGDRGPGLPAGLREALHGHADLPSTPGSSGETGQGLGLLLTLEHLRRMGGRLELRERPEGGTLALAWLPAA